MKRFFAGLLLITGFAVSVSAQDRPRDNFSRNHNNVLKVALSDHSLMIVYINGRRYDKVARSLTIRDLPGGRNTIELYSFTPNQNGKGGDARLIHRGSLRIQPGYFYNAIYDMRSRRMIVDKMNNNLSSDMGYRENGQRNTNDPSTNYEAQDAPAKNNTIDASTLDATIGMSATAFTSLKSRLNKSVSDSDKLKMFQDEMKANQEISVYQLNEIMQLFSFDASKLDVVKAAFSNILDKENTYLLESNFSFNGTKEEFNNFLNK